MDWGVPIVCSRCGWAHYHGASHVCPAYAKWNGDTESEDEYRWRHYGKWAALHKGFYLSPEELERAYNNWVNAFNASCDRLEKEDDAAKIRKLLTDTLGRSTYELREAV